VESRHGKYLVIVSASNPYGFKELEELKKVLLICFVVSLVLTVLAGRIFSSYTIRPVRSIIKSVKNVSANNLHSRLPEVEVYVANPAFYHQSLTAPNPVSWQGYYSIFPPP